MIKPHFNHCPVVWMFYSRQSKNLINKVRQRSPRLTYKDETTDFQHILREQNEIKFHQRYLPVLVTEIYKIVNSIATQLMNSLFQFPCNTNSITSFRELFTENRKTVKNGTEIVTYGTPFVWANLHTKYKNSKSLNEFKSKISIEM